MSNLKLVEDRIIERFGKEAWDNLDLSNYNTGAIPMTLTKEVILAFWADKIDTL